MSIIDILIYTLDWIFQNTLLSLLPSSFSIYPIETLQTSLLSLQALIITSLSGFGFIAPVGLALLLALVVLSAEFSLFGFHIVLFIVKLIRG